MYAGLCVMERDELCHFLEGRGVYIGDDGTRCAIGGGDAAFFPTGWRGRCEVTETLYKVYMIA